MMTALFTLDALLRMDLIVFLVAIHVGYTVLLYFFDNGDISSYTPSVSISLFLDMVL
jgi:hypothetical protein